MSDQQIACSECGGTFTFTAAEQTFYAEKQLAAPPKRCKPCRQARKTARGDTGGGGGGGGNRRFGGGGGNDFRPASNGGGGGGGGFRGPPRGPRPGASAGGGGWSSPGGGGGGAPRAPFNGGGGGGNDRRPAGNFRDGGGGNGRGAPRAPDNSRDRGPSFPSNRGPRPSYDHDAPPLPRFTQSQHGQPGAQQPGPEARPARTRPERPKFDITCAECGTPSQVPFKPLEGRQVFCQPCYRARRGSMDNATEGLNVAEADSGIVE